MKGLGGIVLVLLGILYHKSCGYSFREERWVVLAPENKYVWSGLV